MFLRLTTGFGWDWQSGVGCWSIASMRLVVQTVLLRDVRLIDDGTGAAPARACFVAACGMGGLLRLAGWRWPLPRGRDGERSFMGKR